MRSTCHWVMLSIIVTSLSGCATGPIQFVSDDSGCQLEPGSNEWWAQRALDPPGVRQKCHKGKMWPVRPRPTGPRQQFSHTYHSEHYWPLPYVCQDRAYVRDIIGTQARLGWQEQTTLYHQHFAEDQQLNVPGRLHLIDIVELTPSLHRTIYVQSSYNAEIDNARVTNVQNTLTEITGGTETISVLVRRGRAYSRPASEVKIINDLYNASVPAPRLGAAAGGGGGGATAAVGP